MDLPVLAPRRGLRSLFRRGPHDAEILRLAVPALGALVAEPLFLLGDSAIVGRIGTIPLGSLGVASQVLFTLVNISIFLAYGTTAAVARQLGAGNRRAAIQQGIDGLWLAAGIGTAVLVAGWLFAPELVHAFGASPAVTAGAVTYLRISLFGAPAMLTVLAGTGVLRGLQDTRTPLAVAVCASAANLAVNAIFVLGLHWGLAGSAAGTAIVQNAAGLTYLTVVARGARRAGVALRPDGAGVRSAAFAGVSLVVRTLALQVVLVVTTALAARMGNAAIAAHQIAFRIWSLLALALDAIAIAGQAITGKYLGAGDVAGARAATARMVTWGAVYGVVFGLVILAARPFLPGRLRDGAPGDKLAARRPADRRGAAAGGRRGLRARRGAHRCRGPGLSRAGRARHPGGVRHRRGLRTRLARRPGRPLARLQRVAGRQVRHPDAARQRLRLAGHRRRPLTRAIPRDPARSRAERKTRLTGRIQRS